MMPLRLSPVLKDYLWGGSRLIREYGFASPNDTAAEAWVLCARSDGENRVIGGEFDGLGLSDVLAGWGSAALGSRAEGKAEFPLLIKLIDAAQDLSVQVHPDDAYARAAEGDSGKTEMWYVLDCEEGAQLLYGLSRDVSREDLERAVRNDTVTRLCNTVPVHRGDVFYIPSGTIHAIGRGILIAEVQQNSNATYRVSDYGRLGADGKPRELHIEKSLDVIERTAASVPNQTARATEQQGDARIGTLAECEFFTAKHLALNGTCTVCETDTFVSLVVLRGELTVAWQTGEFTVRKGDSVFIPASIAVSLSGEAELLYSHI